jgi:hypothetical protein
MRGALGFAAAENAIGIAAFGLGDAAHNPSLPTRSAGRRSCHGVTRRPLPAISLYA